MLAALVLNLLLIIWHFQELNLLTIAEIIFLVSISLNFHLFRGISSATGVNKKFTFQHCFCAYRRKSRAINNSVRWLWQDKLFKSRKPPSQLWFSSATFCSPRTSFVFLSLTQIRSLRRHQPTQIPFLLQNKWYITNERERKKISHTQRERERHKKGAAAASSAQVKYYHKEKVQYKQSERPRKDSVCAYITLGFYYEEMNKGERRPCWTPEISVVSPNEIL